MSGLIGGLINASKALAAQQAGVQVAGRNLANITNPNYSRQRLMLGDRAEVDMKLGPVGTGVEVLGIKQIRDQYLDVQVAREIGTTEYLKAQQSAFEKAQGQLGEQVDRSNDSATIGTATSTTTGIGAALGDFFNGFDGLAANPGDAGAKQVLLQRADTLASKFNVADSRLATLQQDLTAQIGTDTASVNNILQRLADLNGEIVQHEIGNPGAALELRDQRQGQLEELGKYMNFTSQEVPGQNGQIEVRAKDATGSDVVLVSKTTVPGALSFNGTQFTAGGAATPLGLSSGSLQGTLDARDGAIQKLRDDLKKTADQFAGAVNTAYNPTGTTGNFFAVPPASGLLAVASTVNFSTLKTTDTTNAGANELALAVAAVGQQKFSTAGGDAFDGTIQGFYTQTVSGFGQTLRGVGTKLDDQNIVQGMITQQRDSVSGVSEDEEVADLMRYQRAYQASARVISVIDSMLDTLVNSLGR